MKLHTLKTLRILTCLLAVVVLAPAPTSEPETTYNHYVERYFKPPLHKTTLKEAYCLTQAIYYEAGNQSEIGKEAVAVVILNRVSSRHYPKTICGVIQQAHIVKERKVCQFSFWCERKRKPIKEMWEESEQIAKRVLQNYWERDILLKLGDAVYYHADYVRPKWRKEKVYLGQIDNHLFYGEKQ